MGEIAERIRPLREALELGRAEFSSRLGVKKALVMKVELGHQRATEELIAAIAREWPQFAYWLTTGKELPDAGQISPETEKLRQESATGREDAA